MAKEYRLEDDLMRKSRPKMGSKRYERLHTVMWEMMANGKIKGFHQCEVCKKMLTNPQSIIIHQGGGCKKKKQ